MASLYKDPALVKSAILGPLNDPFAGLVRALGYIESLAGLRINDDSGVQHCMVVVDRLKAKQLGLVVNIKGFVAKQAFKAGSLVTILTGLDPPIRVVGVYWCLLYTEQLVIC